MKLLQFISVLFCYLFFISEESYSQDILYKKDSTIVKVNIMEFNGKTVTYQTPGDSLRRTYYISKSVLDSLTYQNGKSLSFPFQNKDTVPHLIKRNFIGVDIVNLAKGKPNIWYELMSRNSKISFVGELLINSHPQEFKGWSGHYGAFQYFNFNTHYFFTRFGINFYPFNYSLARAGDIRFSDGLSVLLGSYRRVNWEIYPQGYRSIFAASLMWNVNAKLYIGSRFQIQGGIDISLLPLLTFFCPQICLSIGL
jgi:hypothetical protein